MLKDLRAANPSLRIIHPKDEGFNQFGRLLSDTGWGEMITRAKRLIPADADPMYIPSCPELETPEPPGALLSQAFGNDKTQIGVCRGFNDQLNGMEWHDCPEVICAVTPIVLILGLKKDIIAGRWNSELALCCFLNAGETVELFPDTLHFAPCRVDESPFLSIIALPKGVNDDLGMDEPEDSMLWKERKWLIVHQDSPLSTAGAITGISGKNIRIRQVSDRSPG
jgi:hypothetical protein